MLEAKFGGNPLVESLNDLLNDLKSLTDVNSFFFGVCIKVNGAV